MDRATNDPFWRMSVMVEDDVRRAYEEGGPERLAAPSSSGLTPTCRESTS